MTAGRSYPNRLPVLDGAVEAAFTDAGELTLTHFPAVDDLGAIRSFTLTVDGTDLLRRVLNARDAAPSDPPPNGRTP